MIVQAADRCTQGEALFLASRPRSRHAYWQTLDDRGQLLVTNGSRLFEVEKESIAQFDAAAAISELAVEQLLRDFGVGAPDFVDDVPIQSPRLHALSLAVA